MNAYNRDIGETGTVKENLRMGKVYIVQKKDCFHMDKRSNQENVKGASHKTICRKSEVSSLQPPTPNKEEKMKLAGKVDGVPPQLKGPRTCLQCSSTKTPLWRNGPLGPKVSSICSVHCSVFSY